ncbi:hypothetical protein MKC44_12415, partial [[Clostridium] innocuum]|nr:hypothetical protein [[Clostridium] innocuum]
SHQKIQYILQNIQKKTISFRKLPIYNKKPMSLRKGIGFCQQSERDSTAIPFYPLKNKAVSGCIVCATAEGRCTTVS